MPNVTMVTVNNNNLQQQDTVMSIIIYRPIHRLSETIVNINNDKF